MREPSVGSDGSGDWLGERFAGCFADSRAPELIEHEVKTLVGQRVFGIALGYEDLIDHDPLRHDPAMAVWPASFGAPQGLCAGGRQVDAQPAGTQPAGRRRAITRSAMTAPGSKRCLSICFWNRPAPARTDHPRSRCHRRPVARPSGRPFLPWLLRLLLLPAALRLLRRASAGGEAAARRYRCGGRGGEEVARLVGQIRQRWPGCALCCAPIWVLPATI